MNEVKFVKILKKEFSLFEKRLDKKFPTKEQFSSLKKEISDLDKKFVNKTEFNEFCYEMRNFRKETIEEFKVINEKLDDFKPSAKSLDKILEQYPIERITRLEKHNELSPFTPVVAEE